MLAHECKLVRTAYAILLRRRRRKDEFDPGMFGEPAWDMLLDLYVRETSGASATMKQLEAGSGVTSSTAVRWFQYLESDGLVTRHGPPPAGGTVFVELTDRGRQALDRYLTAILDINAAAAVSEPSTGSAS